MSESILRIRPGIKPLVYLWSSGRLEHVSQGVQLGQRQNIKSVQLLLARS